jgi:hypothetical protein
MTEAARLQCFGQDLSLADENARAFIHVEAGDKIALTEFGMELAKLCTAKPELSTVEVVLFRGLQQQSAGYTFLSVIGRTGKKGILREALLKQMEEVYGRGNGDYFTGYYITIYTQLKLIMKTTEDGKARFRLTVPEAWLTKPPSDSIDE